jgi:hypothetical protein
MNTWTLHIDCHDGGSFRRRQYFHSLGSLGECQSDFKSRQADWRKEKVLVSNAEAIGPKGIRVNLLTTPNTAVLEVASRYLPKLARP